MEQLRHDDKKLRQIKHFKFRNRTADIISLSTQIYIDSSDMWNIVNIIQDDSTQILNVAISNILSVFFLIHLHVTSPVATRANANETIHDMRTYIRMYIMYTPSIGTVNTLSVNLRYDLRLFVDTHSIVNCGDTGNCVLYLGR